VVELWEKREEESSKAFNAFCAYRDLPPHERNLSIAYAKAYKKNMSLYQNGPRKAPAFIKQWSAKFDWVKRCEAWDAYCDKQMEQERLENWKTFKRKLVLSADGLVSKAGQRIVDITNAEIPAVVVSKWLMDAIKIMEEYGKPKGEQNEQLIMEETQRMYVGGRDLVSDVIKRFSEDEDDNVEFE